MSTQDNLLKRRKGRPNHIKCSFCKSKLHNLRTECRYLTNLKNLKWIYKNYYHKVNKLIKFFSNYNIKSQLIKIKYFLLYLNRLIKIYKKFETIKRDKTAENLREEIDLNHYFIKFENFNKFYINPSFNCRNYFHSHDNRNNYLLTKHFYVFDPDNNLWNPVKYPPAVLNAYYLMFGKEHIRNIYYFCPGDLSSFREYHKNGKYIKYSKDMVEEPDYIVTLYKFKLFISTLIKFINNIIPIKLPDVVIDLILEYHILDYDFSHINSIIKKLYSSNVKKIRKKK